MSEDFKNKLSKIVHKDPNDDDETLILLEQEAYNYIDILYPYFNIGIENKTVLEIGAFEGWHTCIVEDHNPKSMTLIEPNVGSCDHLKSFFPNADVINDDILMYLETPRQFDVVVCCGVLYHLHAPLHLLELIANRVNPEIVILETYTGEDPEYESDLLYDATFNVEENENCPGQRYTLNGWKTAGLSLMISQSVIDYSMNNLGYELVNKCNLFGKTKHPSKDRVTLSTWKRK